jgi:hypothetical protein
MRGMSHGEKWVLRASELSHRECRLDEGSKIAVRSVVKSEYLGDGQLVIHKDWSYHELGIRAAGRSMRYAGGGEATALGESTRTISEGWDLRRRSTTTCWVEGASGGVVKGRISTRNKASLRDRLLEDIPAVLDEMMMREEAK